MNLLNVWKARGEIFEGIMNRIFTKEHVEEVAMERMSICKECEQYSKSCLVPGTSPCCAICGCSLSLKTRSLSSDCPDGKWERIMTEDEEDLLNDILNE